MFTILHLLVGFIIGLTSMSYCALAIFHTGVVQSLRVCIPLDVIHAAQSRLFNWTSKVGKISLLSHTDQTGSGRSIALAYISAGVVVSASIVVDSFLRPSRHVHQDRHENHLHVRTVELNDVALRIRLATVVAEASLISIQTINYVSTSTDSEYVIV